MTNWRSYILKAMLASLAVTALAGIAAIFMSDEVVWRIAGTGLVTAVSCVLMLRLSRSNACFVWERCWLARLRPCCG